MAIRGTREWDKAQTQKKFLEAIERLISGNVKHKKELKTLKVNDSNVCKEAGLKNGALKHYPRLQKFIKIKAKFPDAIWTDDGDFQYVDGTTISLDTVVDTLNKSSKSRASDKQKKNELAELNKLHVDAVNNALENQIAVTEPFVAALMEALPDAKKAELIEKYEKVLHRHDYGGDVIHAIFGKNKLKVGK